MNTDEIKVQAQEELCDVVDAGAGETLRIVRWDEIISARYSHDHKLKFAVGMDDGGVGTLSVNIAPYPGRDDWLLAETGGKRYGACAIVLPPQLLELVRAQARRLCAEQHRSGTNCPWFLRILMQLIIELENAACGWRSRQEPWNSRVAMARNLAESALFAVIATRRGNADRSVEELLACDAEAGDAIAKLRSALAALERKPKFCEGRISTGRYYRLGLPNDEFADIDAFLAYLLKMHEEACKGFANSAAALAAWEAASAITGATEQVPQKYSGSSNA